MAPQPRARFWDYKPEALGMETALGHYEHRRFQYQTTTNVKGGAAERSGSERWRRSPVRDVGSINRKLLGWRYAYVRSYSYLWQVHRYSVQEEPKEKEAPKHYQKTLNPKRVRTGWSRGGLLGRGATLPGVNPKP